jgi:hypothetical protein
MRRTSLGCVAVIALCAALLAGCGGGSSSGSDTPQDAARAYVDARNQGDAGKVCELYSTQLIRQLHAANCEAFVREQSSGVATSLSLVGVQQNGDRATATITSSVAGGEVGGAAGRLRITLERQDGDWKITALAGGAGD